MKTIFALFLIFSSFVSFASIEKAVFAGGCFWCMEYPFEQLPGVRAVISGYTGGKSLNPTYKEVSSGSTGHIESVEVTFDTALITYEKLVEVFWKNIDPLDASGQFCDKGEQYTSGIFYLNSSQKLSAEKKMKDLQSSGKFQSQKIHTFIKPASTFYPAEEYHQDYYKKNPVRYKFYRFNCGRDKRLEKVWGT